MRLFSFALAGALAAGAAAAPRPWPTCCKGVDEVVKALSAIPPVRTGASSFCSSFLHYPIRTTTTASITPTQTQLTTLPPVTQSTTVSTTDLNTITSDATVYAPDATVTVTAIVTAGTRTIYQKRDELDERAPTPAPEEARGLPGALARFAARELSSACSCIVAPTTTTLTATATASPATVVQTVGPTATVVVTYTATVEVTTTVPETVTEGPTATDTVTAASTVTPILVKPKLCNAQGLPGPNAFNYDANFNTDQASCIASCKTDSRCLSTGFYIVTDPTTGSQTGTCRYYDKSVTDSADLGPGYYNFNDKAC